MTIDFTSKPRLYRNTDIGFSLIEIMLVLVIFGVLLSFAVPSYQNYTQEARRTDGHLLLRNNALVLERCLTFTGSYTNCSLLTESDDNYYILQETRTSTTYQLEAIPGAKGGQNKDQNCLSLTLNHRGKKGATGSEPETCW